MEFLQQAASSYLQGQGAGGSTYGQGEGLDWSHLSNLAGKFSEADSRVDGDLDADTFKQHLYASGGHKHHGRPGGYEQESYGGEGGGRYNQPQSYSGIPEGMYGGGSDGSYGSKPEAGYGQPQEQGYGQPQGYGYRPDNEFANAPTPDYGGRPEGGFGRPQSEYGSGGPPPGYPAGGGSHQAGGQNAPQDANSDILHQLMGKFQQEHGQQFTGGQGQYHQLAALASKLTGQTIPAPMLEKLISWKLSGNL